MSKSMDSRDFSKSKNHYNELLEEHKIRNVTLNKQDKSYDINTSRTDFFG